MNYYPDPDPSSPLRKTNGNGEGNTPIISLINHYTAFNETLKANSASGIVHYSAGEMETPKSPREVIIPAIPVTVPTGRTFGLIIAVIPAYNEELTIGSVVLLARKYVDGVIVIDDGSTDKTSLIAKTAGADVITMPENQGKAAAMMKGFARARELDAFAVVMLDSDGQHTPDEIPSVLKPVIDGKADLVIGSRFLGDGNTIPRYRQLGQKTLDIATQVGSGFASSDSQSGFRAVSKNGLEHLTFESRGYNIESDMITHFLHDGLTITEVPITVKYDVPNGHKKNPIAHGYDIISHLVGIIGYRRPLLTFGIPGIMLVITGLLFGSWAFATYYTTGKLPFGPSVVLGVALVSGLFLILGALILNSLVMIIKMEK